MKDIDLYIQKKQGPREPILWIHGYTLDSNSWQEMWELLPEYTHIGIDLPGHGMSADIQEGNTLNELSPAIFKICKTHQIQHIIALSFGTITALQIALDNPTYFKTITLAAPTLAGGPQDMEMSKVYTKLIMLQYIYKKVHPVFSEIWLQSPAWQGLDQIQQMRSLLIDTVHKHRWDELSTPTKYKQFIEPPQNIDKIRNITTPILLMIGEYEMTAFKETANIIQQHAPHAQIQTLSDTYHLCLLQSPHKTIPYIKKHLQQATK